ncbi:glycosyltransferase [Dokdonia sinensis]|uniref:Glycosyltransferase n=1 Tax=Dokdonia sinensis TaxID=2479847 RepID=A0A3M0G6S9_9FLAO|nr:glycosyltransferase [Dokdonia sinensis]RMB57433.1 glycosyltransferase [Dokdonia sinensis]
MDPLVSICIPTYNGALYLEEALTSVKNQTYKNIEVVISDDQSSDCTMEILERFRESVSFPVYIYSHEPLGIGANWNNTVEKANGKYIKFLFQDDVLRSDCTEKMVRLALSDTNIAMVYCKRHFIYDTANPRDVDWVEKYKSLHTHWHNIRIEPNQVYKGRELLKNKNLLGVPVNKIGEPPATLLKRDIMLRTGPFNTELKQALDIEYWYRLMNYGDIAFIDETLISFRVHEEQASAVNLRNAVNDIFDLEKSLGKHIFWHLHPYNQKVILYRHYFLGKLWKKLKRSLRIK